MMFRQLQPGSRLSQDEETASLLVSVGAARRNYSHPQNGAQGARARRGLPRRSEPFHEKVDVVNTNRTFAFLPFFPFAFLVERVSCGGGPVKDTWTRGGAHP